MLLVWVGPITKSDSSFISDVAIVAHMRSFPIDNGVLILINNHNTNKNNMLHFIYACILDISRDQSRQISALHPHKAIPRWRLCTVLSSCFCTLIKAAQFC